MAPVCILLQGVNAAFDVLLICNVNVYELSQRLLLRKNLLDVSYSSPPSPLLSVINYALPCMINVIPHTSSVQQQQDFGFIVIMSQPPLHECFIPQRRVLVFSLTGK